MHARSTVLGLLLLPALSGCFGQDATPPAPTAAPYVFVDPMTTDPAHDHRDFAQHQFRSNVSLVSHLPLIDQEGETAQSHAIDICDRWAVVAREFPGTEGVDIVDISDPQELVWVGTYRDSRAVGGDRNVAWSADCRFIFMANEGQTVQTSGVRVIRAEDKSRPTFESFYSVNPQTPLPTDCVVVAGTPVACSVPGGGVHTVYALKTGGVQYVYALNAGVHILRLEEPSGQPAQLALVGRYVASDAAKIEEVNRNGPDTTSTRRAVMGHDMTVYEEQGKVILYLANAYSGLVILDITTPSGPVEVARWVPGGSGAPHYVHGVESYFKDGRRITIVESETFEDRNTNTPSPIWILDTTDPRAIRQLSEWVNPGRHGADHLLFSAHFFALDGDRIWLTHYHGGVWVIDIADPARPVVAGYYLPGEDTAYTPSGTCCGGWKLGGVPMTFDVAVRDGVAFAADFSTGLYALRLETP